MTDVTIHLFSKVELFEEIDLELVISSNQKSEDLQQILYGIIDDENLHSDPQSLQFLFIINGVLFRNSLEQFIEENSLSKERTIDIEFTLALKEPEIIETFEHPDWIASLASLDNEYISGLYNQHIEIPSLGMNWLAHPAHISGLAYSRETIISGCNQGIVRAWKVDGSPFFETILHPGSIESISFNKTGLLFATCCWDSKVRIFSVSLKEGMINVDTDLKRDPSGSNQKQLIKQPLLVLEEHVKPVISSVWADDNQLITSSMDKTVKVWNIEEQTCQLTIHCHSVPLSIDVCENYLTVGYADGTISVHDFTKDKNHLLMRSSRKNSHVLKCSGVKFVKKDSIVSICHDGTLNVWNTHSKFPLHMKKISKDRLLCMTVAKNNEVYVGGAEAKVFKVNISEI
eukprot:TRINITY_DN3192_c0_g4_i1.p1 TRINITY_DN3192_c0_g4~~TRINITY_DN3192_c0_g4_i1.p1  ORF type:complete len:412 (+),score=122.98 TRINITY_DN3192_c0_g4_i1:35-1237(+)